jgi:hypothetical protein
MRKMLRLPSPAMVVALIALLVALGGTAAAAKIVAHARLADNALRLQGKTAAQVAALVPPPAAAKATFQIADMDLAGNVKKEFRITCPGGTTAIGGGVSSSNPPAYFESRPIDPSTWSVFVQNPTQSELTGKIYAVCLG